VATRGVYDLTQREVQDPAARFRRMTFWRRLSRPTRWAALAGALATGILLGPFVIAALLLRSSDDARGPTLGAYVVLGALLVLLMVAGGAVVGAAVAGLRRVMRK